MAIKTFSVNEVLTAADTNTYLANSGLVYITQKTAPGGSSTLSFDNCFSSTYENYRIVISNADGSTASGLYMRTRNGGTDRTTNYFYAFMGLDTAGNASNDFSGSAGNFPIGYLSASGAYSVATVDIFQVYSASTETYINTQFFFYLSPRYYARSGGGGRGADQNDGFTIYADVGTLDGLNVRVYGYRQA